MEPAKYIVLEENGTETALIFPCWMLHKTMAGQSNQIVSAGKVRFSITEAEPTESQKAWNAKPLKIKAHCYGKSVGLNIESRPEEDEYLIEKTILNCEG